MSDTPPVDDHEHDDDIIECGTCQKPIWFRNSFSPKDETICGECDTEITGKTNPPSINPEMDPPPQTQTQLALELTSRLVLPPRQRWFFSECPESETWQGPYQTLDLALLEANIERQDTEDSGPIYVAPGRKSTAAEREEFGVDLPWWVETERILKFDISSHTPTKRTFDKPKPLVTSESKLEEAIAEEVKIMRTKATTLDQDASKHKRSGDTKSEDRCKTKAGVYRSIATDVERALKNNTQ